MITSFPIHGSDQKYVVWLSCAKGISQASDSSSDPRKKHTTMKMRTGFDWGQELEIQFGPAKVQHDLVRPWPLLAISDSGVALSSRTLKKIFFFVDTFANNIANMFDILMISPEKRVVFCNPYDIIEAR